MASLSGQSNDFSHKFALVCRRSSSMFEKKIYIYKRKGVRVIGFFVALFSCRHLCIIPRGGGGNWVDRRCRINKWTAVRSKWNKVVHRGDKWWCGEWLRIFRVAPFPWHERWQGAERERERFEIVCFREQSQFLM